MGGRDLDGASVVFGTVRGDRAWCLGLGLGPGRAGAVACAGVAWLLFWLEGVVDVQSRISVCG